ncbi:hypothetical protein HN873_058579 [Arachis hypogaea]
METGAPDPPSQCRSYEQRTRDRHIFHTRSSLIMHHLLSASHDDFECKHHGISLIPIHFSLLTRRCKITFLSNQFEGGMEPSPSTRYNLRSRGRIIGNRLLRLRRGVPVYNSSANHHHQSWLQKPCGPSILRGTDEELGTQRQSRLCYMEMFQPYPLVAMQHYNKMLKEEEQYKVYDYANGIMTAFEKVGDFHQLHILGVPKSFEYMQNSPDDDVPVKHFYARIHQAPKKDTHVDYCEPFEGEGPPLRGLDIRRIVPLCCKYCGLANGNAIESRSLELSKQAEADGEDSDSDYWDGYSDPNAPKKEIRSALAEFRRRR